MSAYKNTSTDQDDQCMKRKRRWGAKTRWGDTDQLEKDAVLVGLPMVIPSGLTKDQEEQYLLQLHIEEITRRLHTGELGIPPIGERSPSPEPVYDHVGKRTNTRDVRTRRKLEDERHKLVQKVVALNPQYRPPGDYRVPNVRYSEKIFIPQEEHPEIGFIGMIIGPRGNSLRKIEKETGACIVIRGKGSVKEGRIGMKDGKPLPGADEPLHAYITSFIEEHVKKGADRIRKLIDNAINMPEEDNDWMRDQLHELAVINGTLRDANDPLQKLREMRDAETIITNKIICIVCGGAGHISKDCKRKRSGESFTETIDDQPLKNKKMDVENPIGRPIVPMYARLALFAGLKVQITSMKMLSRLVQSSHRYLPVTDSVFGRQQYLSLMAELGQGSMPSASLHAASAFAPARPQVHQHQWKPLALPAPVRQTAASFSQPPVNQTATSFSQPPPPPPLMQLNVRPSPMSLLQCAMPPPPPPLSSQETSRNDFGLGVNMMQQQPQQPWMPSTQMHQFPPYQSWSSPPHRFAPQPAQHQQNSTPHGYYGAG